MVRQEKLYVGREQKRKGPGAHEPRFPGTYETVRQGSAALKRLLTEMGQKAPDLESGDEWPFGLALSVVVCHVIDMDYQHERHNVHLVVYHIIWCPKRRRKVLGGPVCGVTGSSRSSQR